MKIRIESSASNGKRLTGVGYYARRLTDSLRSIEKVDVIESQFDFRGRQLGDYKKRGSIERINFPQKIYAKLDYVGIAFPFDLLKKKVDVTIFPNYALWPTVNSRLKIVTIHDLSFMKYPEVVEEKNLRYLERIVPRAVKKSDLILTVSETVKKDLIATYHVPEEKIHVTPIPPTEEYFQKSERDVHSTYGIPTESYILFASTIEPRKNLSVLLDAYASLPESIRTSVSLVVAGGWGWKSDDIKDKLQKMQLNYHNIITTGYYDQADAGALYQKASVFVMPSHYEGFGMPLLEAMAAGTPTIASDIPVLREVCGDASLFFDPNDAAQLRDRLVSVLEDTGTSDELIAKGTHNLKGYSWDKVAKDLIDRLRTLL